MPIRISTHTSIYLLVFAEMVQGPASVLARLRLVTGQPLMSPFLTPQTCRHLAVHPVQDLPGTSAAGSGLFSLLGLPTLLLTVRSLASLRGLPRGELKSPRLSSLTPCAGLITCNSMPYPRSWEHGRCMRSPKWICPTATVWHDANRGPSGAIHLPKGCKKEASSHSQACVVLRPRRLIYVLVFGDISWLATRLDFSHTYPQWGVDRGPCRRAAPAPSHDAATGCMEKGSVQDSCGIVALRLA
ncbi:hypothetical protein LY76DRAFT_328017 [Colletotrichum caudatum]|nr:hypothetical protein LY76DRAFT_328017 [Colletotrichum caudatum]